jgi:hypothetical protein
LASEKQTIALEGAVHYKSQKIKRRVDMNGKNG